MMEETTRSLAQLIAKRPRVEGSTEFVEFVDGLTPEKLNDMVVRQREKACRAAVDLENQRRGSKVYELVEAIRHNGIMFNGVWHHVNFKARSKTPDVDVYSYPKLFFAEVDSYSREITSFSALRLLVILPPQMDARAADLMRLRFYILVMVILFWDLQTMPPAWLTLPVILNPNEDLASCED
ncbi:hypothetical protein Droror1_Dr00001629 [Drosera rotundifolia]